MALALARTFEAPPSDDLDDSRKLKSAYSSKIPGSRNPSGKFVMAVNANGGGDLPVFNDSDDEKQTSKQKQAEINAARNCKVLINSQNFAKLAEATSWVSKVKSEVV